ncbi:FAD-dependent oxidoreductase [Lentzea flava]|uniref:FAD-dependent oxidoreductase n=1 Tax=Lentzea flava TaxID=103732 RepID=A0ABQ2UJ53_9PSEU|nr:NAD(P)/FAD-dependent oxidoreductase [Lentzea flava]MCP2199142.1 2-polyprenyl-6-methoxyphenol hydroxylase [Lentzea flava]GGU34223.1 FAD-dependent oxidoreductase [Lentzea flava]
MDYDVIIVGASIAGCTAAIEYGRAGLRVALLERHRSPQAHKTLCGHFILGGTHDVLRRLGFWQPMLDRGAAVTTGLGVWTGSGWIVPTPGNGVPPAISLRRSKLDPLLREIAAATPGVDLLMGHRVTGLAETGVVTDAGTRLHARLVVGADGHHSTVARLAGVGEDVAPNERFLFWTYYEGALMNGPGDGQVWQLDPDVAVCIQAGDGLTLVGVFPAKHRLAEFTEDRAAAFDRFVARLPGGPSLSGARQVSNLIGTTDYPCVRRDPTPRPWLALIGDAATASDPVPAVGCGWAFRSAAWLAEATTGPLRDGGDLRPALRQYRRAHRFIDRYDDLGRQDALARPPAALRRVIRAAGVTDPWIARRLAMFGMRAAAPSVLLNPKVVVRALLRSRLAG